MAFESSDREMNAYRKSIGKRAMPKGKHIATDFMQKGYRMLTKVGGKYSIYKYLSERVEHVTHTMTEGWYEKRVINTSPDSESDEDDDADDADDEDEQEPEPAGQGDDDDSDIEQERRFREMRLL
jgi:hypothetical protein